MSPTCQGPKSCFAFRVFEPQERARSLLGSPFRLQGRDPRVGVDCLGVVIWAYALPEPNGARYRAEDGDWPIVEQRLGAWFEPAAAASSNHLLVFRLARSFHFGVISEGHFVHADAAIGRVVLRKLPERLIRGCRIFKFRGDC